MPDGRLWADVLHTERGTRDANATIRDHIRYQIWIHSREHLRGLTADLPPAMRDAIHETLDPHLPESHDEPTQAARYGASRRERLRALIAAGPTNYACPQGPPGWVHVETDTPGGHPNWSEDPEPFDPDADAPEGQWPQDEEPDEGDYVSTNWRHWYQDGNLVVTVPDGEDHAPHLRAHADQAQYWPSAWWVSDDGNAHPVDYSRGAVI